MDVYTLNKIKNENKWGKLGGAPIKDKTRENCLRWFDHVYRRPVDAIVGRIDV